MQSEGQLTVWIVIVIQLFWWQRELPICTADCSSRSTAHLHVLNTLWRSMTSSVYMGLMQPSVQVLDCTNRVFGKHHSTEMTSLRTVCTLLNITDMVERVNYRMERVWSTARVMPMVSWTSTTIYRSVLQRPAIRHGHLVSCRVVEGFVAEAVTSK